MTTSTRTAGDAPAAGAASAARKGKVVTPPMRLPTVSRSRTLKGRLLSFVIAKTGNGYVPDVVRTLLHRPDLFGKAMGEAFQDAMRRPSDWQVWELELFASFVSLENQCVF